MVLVGHTVTVGHWVGATPGQVVGVLGHTVGPPGQVVATGVATQEVGTTGKTVGCTSLSTLTRRMMR